MTTYRIPEMNLDPLRARIEKMNRRAAKLGMPPVVLATTGEAWELFVRRMGEDAGPQLVTLLDGESLEQAQARLADPRRPAVFTRRRLVLVTITGELPRVNGWTLAAVINHDEAGNIVRHVPGVEDDLPRDFRTAPPTCDHCRLSRQRNETYVLQSETAGWKRVGRNCLADFIRSTDAGQWAAAAEWLSSFAGLCEEFEEEHDGPRGRHYFSTLDFLAQVAAVIRLDGFVSRTQAKDAYPPVCATSDFAMGFFCGGRIDREISEKYEVTAPDTERAEKAITWAQELPADAGNDYLWNIRVISLRESISAREAGLAASICSAYNRDQERKAEAATILDEHFGIIGKRAEYTLTVTATREINGNYGLTTLYKFRDCAGRVAAWFCSGSAGLEIGATCRLTGTVKAHELYQGKRQTTLTRCKVAA